MATRAQAEANRSNAKRSTGPKTAGGRAKSAKNALSRGLRSAAPVLPGEPPEEWEEHRSGILRSLAPSGPLESELAGRVALCLWRLRRVAAFEAGVTAVQVEEARGQAGDAPGEGCPERARLRKARKELEDKRGVNALWQGSFELLRDLEE